MSRPVLTSVSRETKSEIPHETAPREQFWPVKIIREVLPSRNIRYSAAGSGIERTACRPPFALPRRAPPCRGALGGQGLARAWGPAAPGSGPPISTKFVLEFVEKF